MISIEFLGACGEVGRSGVVIRSSETGDAVLCDYGIKITDEAHFPKHVRGKDLSAVILTHSHIDHCGGIPIFYISGSVPLLCTELTFRVTEILLKDMLSIADNFLPFGRPEIAKMRKYSELMEYNKPKQVGLGTTITLINAGHIPGSAMILVEMEGYRILYTGDYNTIPTQLISPANPEDVPPIDCLITEATYGNSIHSPRKGIEDSLLEHAASIVENKGTLLIPAFGVARSQEIAMVLNRDGIPPFHITIDGMARQIAALYEKYPRFLANFPRYVQTMNYVRLINQRKRISERQNAARSPGVIIAPSGMLKGGTARYYMEEIMHLVNCGVDLVSYQVEDTPGKILLEQKKYSTAEGAIPVEIKADVHHFDFSSHIDKPNLYRFIQKVKWVKKPLVFCIHGEKETLEIFSQNLLNDLGIQVSVPNPGDIVNVDTDEKGNDTWTYIPFTST